MIVDGFVYWAGSKGFPATAAGGLSVTMVRWLAAVVAGGRPAMVGRASMCRWRFGVLDGRMCERVRRDGVTSDVNQRTSWICGLRFG